MARGTRKSPKRPSRARPPAPSSKAALGLHTPDHQSDFPIVGIGASAGGLEAFTQLLRALPADTGMAFVFVQHLMPTHESALTDILSRATPMPVMEVRDEPVVEPNHVYVIAPGKDMVIARGRLHSEPRRGRGAHHPVDQFFRALAEDRRHQALGVVLSGTATDGTLGLEAIKAEGGLTFAQDDTAQHEGMPHSAIASGCVDFVLPPDAIAREIVRIGHHAYAVPEGDTRPPTDERSLTQVLHVLHRVTGVDFTHYKFNTLYRRVTRRMVLSKIDDLQEYLRLLQGNPTEVEALYHDVLIKVTSFFRDVDAYDALKEKVFPRLIAGRAPHDPVRIWSLGCSTGQEAYSLAMAFAEVSDAARGSVPLQIFATDIDEQSVGTARTAVYSKDIAQDVSPERLRRFFVDVEARYQIVKSIRDVCVFSRHNVLTDPPFSRIDLISCRNLLIYLEPVLQQRIVPILHYALKPSGFLWLGGSETIAGFRNLFEAEDARHKIYARKPVPREAHVPLPHDRATRSSLTPNATRPASTGFDLYREADRLLLRRFAPPGVIVSADLDILEYRGETGPYLAPAPGKASLLLLKMLRDGLLVGVRTAIARAGKERTAVRTENLRVKSDGGHREVAVEIVPLKGNGDDETSTGGGFLILFEEASRTSVTREDAARPSLDVSASDAGLTRVTQELSATREYLQSVVEQQQAANEELQSANEEVQSANEELQSLNEELETSKEEIQSSNEELATVNDELNNRNVELNRLNNDLVNLLGSVDIAIVILGPDLRIRRFTPAAEQMLTLGPADIGRALTDITLTFDGLPDLGPLLTEVIDTVTVAERDVRDTRGHWYSLRLRPYRTVDNKIDGVVVILIDVDAMKRTHAFTESIVGTVRDPLVVLDVDLRVRAANDAFYRTFAVKHEHTEGCLLFELGNGQWNIPGLRRLLEEVLPRDNEFHDFQVEHQFAQIGRKTMRLNARRLVQPGDATPSILLTIEDVTDQIAAAEATSHLAAIVTSSEDAIISKDLDGIITSWNTGAEHLFGYTANEIVGQSVMVLIPADHVAEEPKILESVRRGEVVPAYETVRKRKDGRLVNISLTVSPMHDAEGHIVGASKIARDITRRKRAEEELRRSLDFNEMIRLNMGDGLYTVDAQGLVTSMNPAAERLFGWQADELLGRKMHDVTHYKHRDGSPFPADDCAVLRVLREGALLTDQEDVFITKDGTFFDVVYSSSPLRMGDAIVGVVVVFRDMSDRWRVEQTLRRHAEQFEVLLNEVPLGVYLIDADFRISHVSPTTFQVFGNIPDLIGRDFDEVIHILWPKAYADEIVQRFHHTLDTGEPYKTPERGEERLDRGVTEIYEWQINRIPLPDGRYGVVCYFRDIFAQVQAERALQQAASDLADADRRKDEFLAMLAHELRNPLAPIRTAVQILGAPGVPAATSEKVRVIIERQIQTMTRLIEDLLDAARITQGKVEMKMAPGDLTTILRHAADLVRPLVAERHQEMSVALPPGPCYLSCDTTRLEQAFGNILHNASKYTRRDGHIWVSLDTRSTSDHATEAIVRVRDDGIGIRGEDLSGVFDLFMQAGRSPHQTHGLGIGLSLVQRIVGVHGGRVDVTSAGVNQGSEFTVHLPLLAVAPAGGVNEGEPDAGQTEDIPRRILVVDDNVDAAETLAELLRLRAHDVRVAQDGSGALDTAAAFLPEIVFLDIRMDEIDGYEVARRLRQLPGLNGALIVAVTGFGRNEDRRLAASAGFDRFLIKPLDPAALQALLTIRPRTDAV